MTRELPAVPSRGALPTITRPGREVGASIHLEALRPEWNSGWGARLLLLTTLLCGGCLYPALDPPFSRNQAHEGDSPHSIQVGNSLRHYILHLPPGDVWSVRHPLLVMLHGTGSSAQRMPGQTGLGAAADPRGIIVAYPDGTGRWPIRETWHTGHCCGYALENRVEDVQFIQDLIGALVRELDVDTSRIYVAGFSDGGMMTFRLGCELAGTIAAIAVVAGRMPDVRCRPARPLPVLAIGGNHDDELRKDHARYTHPGSYPYAWSIQASVGFWASIDQCDPVPERISAGKHWEERYAHCVDDTDVTLYTISGGEHAWPGGRKGWLFSPAPVKDFDATDVILDFFERHRR
jgi:polyhydroxybutyrate depolymerase